MFCNCLLSFIPRIKVEEIRKPPRSQIVERESACRIFAMSPHVQHIKKKRSDDRLIHEIKNIQLHISFRTISGLSIADVSDLTA